MKRNRILRLSCYLFLLGFGILLCLMPACNLFKDSNEEKPPEDEDSEDPPETENEDNEEDEDNEDPPETENEEDKEDPPETEKEDDEDNEEEPPETENEEDEEEDEEPPETENEEDEEEPEEPPAKVQYKKDSILLIKSERYYYFARVTKDTDTNAKEVPVHIYAEHLREQMGETIAVDKVHRTRAMPSGGWGTRSVAAEYFKDAEWTFTWDAFEMADHYSVPLEDGEKHRVEFKDIRLPIPVER